MLDPVGPFPFFSILPVVKGLANFKDSFAANLYGDGGE